MAKKIKKVQDILDELQNRGAFTDAAGNFNQEAAEQHVRERIKAMEIELKKWDELKYAIQSHYAELDRLSGKKYRLFNVPTWKEELNNAEKDYKHYFKTLKAESDNFNAKWGKATIDQIHENYDEWLADNNKLVEMQKKSLEQVEALAKKAMDAYRDGMNIFDRWTPHIQAMFRGMVKGVDETKEGLNKMWTAYKEWTEPWARANQVAADFSKNVGLGAAGMKNLLSETIRFANQAQIGIKYNKSLEEMIKLQQEYTNSVGRNINLTDNYKESLAAMSAVMGDQKTADIAGKLENFGINSEETGKRIGKMFADASKKGIAFSKYSETFANNIKMAQNYTFANGVKGVASMAEKATKLKLEMMSVAQFADKVSTVEGAITTGAKLQVLGGSFTQFADPLQMLYEGTSDAEGIQDRIINMFGDLGRFNKLTGEVEVSALDRQRIKAAGEAIGVNPSELMDMVHAKGKRNEIANQMRGLGYSNELQELIMNTASFDENGNAGVSINGQFVGVDQLAGREQELIALNQTETEDIKEIATLLRGWDDTMQGFQKQKDAKQASWVEKSGLGAMGMRVVQYLGQANWALNTIVGFITAGKAINFGMGAYGTAAGVTRTGAAAFQRVRMNNWMKRNKLNDKNLKYSQRIVGKNIGVLISPDGSGNRPIGAGSTDLRSVIRDGYRSQGADLGINNGGVVLDPNRGYGNYLSRPGMLPGTPSVNPNPMDMGTASVSPGGVGYHPGTTTFGTASVAPVAQGTASVAPVAQGTASVNPVAQGTASVAPVAQGTASVAPVTQGTASVNPVAQGTASVAPVAQGTASVAPVAQGTASVNPVAQGTASVAPVAQGTASVAPVTQGTASVNPVAQGTASVAPVAQGTASVNPVAQGTVAQAQGAATTQAVARPTTLPPGAVASTSSNLSLYNTNKANTWHDGAGNKVVLDKKGNYRLYTEGKKGYTNLGKSLDAQKYQEAVQTNQKAIRQSMPKYQFNGEAGQKLASNEVLKLKNGTSVRMGDFQYSETNPNQLINPKTKQKITMNPKNGQWMLSQKGQRGFVNLGRTVEGGGFQTNNNTVTSTRTSTRSKFKQWGRQSLANAGGLKGIGYGMAGAAGMMLGAGIGMGAHAVEAKRLEQIANGKIKENSNEDWRKRNTSTALGWAGQGASAGAMIGSFFGPIGTAVGAVAGAIIGGIGGLIKGKSEQKREQEKVNLLDKIARFRNGQRLTGEYSNDQLRRISKYVETNDASHVTNDDLNALKKNGNDYNIIVRKKMAKGGLIAGPSHANGGVAVAGTGIEVEGGEFIMNRQATVRNIGLLKQMNAGENIKPMPLNTQSMMVTPSVPTPQISNVGPTEISLKPLDININGTIKLDAGKGNQVDITKLLMDNPKFVRDITEMIEKQININTNGAYNKEKSLNKF